jgi:hypothetical protein
MAAPLRNQEGSALILAVMAMLIMGVLSVSFALLADIESRVGVAYKQQAQAEALAEAALERARDAVRTAPAVAGGFTKWFDGTLAAHGLFAGQSLNGGLYSARIDNDCAVVNTIPVQLQEPDGVHAGIPNTPCDNAVDNNEVAVITAWATAGPNNQGRSRVRAIVGVDNPWKHVCSNAKPDNNGYCNEPGNRNGNPTVSPADPNDPNGPQAYDALPKPILGCSRIAPRIHVHPATAIAEVAACTNPAPAPAGYSGMFPTPYPTAPGTPRMVLMGEIPGGVGTRSCGAPWDEPAGGNNNRYFGYFDCALVTYCIGALGDVCNGGDRYGCLRGQAWWNVYGATLGPLYGIAGPDTRVVHGHANQIAFNAGFTALGPLSALRFNEWDPVSNTCRDRRNTPLPPPPFGIGPGQPAAGNAHGDVNNPPGMVHRPAVANGNVNFNNNIGSPAKQFTVYVLDGSASFGNNRQYYGTFVVEGNETNDPCSDKDFQMGNGASSQLWAGPNATPPPAGWTFTNQYGFPLAALIYNPDLPEPTIAPTYAPQGTCADLGSANSELHGMVYSGGHAEFNPLTMDGTVVAFEIQTQGSATYTYSTWYGNNSPPPGFPYGTGNQVVIIRKSFVVCTNYADDSVNPSPCN